MGSTSRRPATTVYASRPNKIEVTMTAPTTHRLSAKEQPFPWHEDFDEVVDGYNAYSPSGDVTGEVVYANLGLPEDYEALDELGVSVAGKDRAGALRRLVPRRQGAAGRAPRAC